MITLSFPVASFDAVAAFYSLIHVPRDEQAGLLRAIAVWLQPGGLLIAGMGRALMLAALSKTGMVAVAGELSRDAMRLAKLTR
jgi:SAM-dependent methyltransferase